MKKIIFAVLFQFAILNLQFATAQVYVESDGKASFFSEAPLENIDAHNDSVSAALNISTKEMAVVMQMRHFEFKKKLMQEHFNEKYLHTDKYPKANFKGKIQDEVDFSKDGTYEVTVEGDLTIHNITKHRKEKATLTVSGGKITGKTEFKVRVADHNIEIPTIVLKNIAEEVLVKIDLTFEPKK